MPEYVADCGAGSGNDIFTLRRYIERADLKTLKMYFEFKRDDTADAALKQIDSKDYALPFVADTRKRKRKQCF